ncbi:MAG TPA: M20 family metallopeptidase [Clostridiales bacterium]|jgi:hypothetical protein|nr:M20 family metallopeptidase [Clostridiales bacterium]
MDPQTDVRSAELWIDACLTFSNDSYGLLKLTAGEGCNVVPSLAEVESERGISMRIDGKAAPISMPEQGINAIIGLCELLSDQPVLQDKRFSRLINWYKNEDSDRLEFPLPETAEQAVAVPARLWMEGDDIKLVISFRPAPGINHSDIEKVLNDLGRRYQFSYELHSSEK